MNLFNIFDEITQVDSEFPERISPRRAAIRNLASMSTKVAAAGLPLMLGSLFKKAYGQQAPTDVTGVLNYALTLEYLEAAYYTKGTAASGLIPAGPGRGAIATIRDHEIAHVAFLKQVLGSDAVAQPEFDFTAGGTFGNVFTDYDTFLALAQAFEDTGVRAYKGQAGLLKGNQVVLTAALQIHAAEARHASHIRQMRRARGGAAAAQKPWITGANDSGIGAAVDPVYAGEDNVSQAGVNIPSLNGIDGKLSNNAATESFDEPLTAEAVLAIAGLFIK
ncbi:ferritin-like domain-containing protein [Parapedobacter indicus]|uniref:Ferritin-like domain-containing protein n=1 Tax=Parapedobacter indicus TaxID=1477437 RepID=A0A1I3SMF0_9SPHI|nr:ferritin-like domain-containing protein [Parapedobacter indicus]PPK99795.1 ferritin-like protein [Parapedobacter indicus]SFJ58567.1 Ferritin-like domain-containing protein [Parapedobacter indicus]